MVRLIVSMLLVGLLAQDSQAQLFGRLRSNRVTYSTCPAGGCPTDTQWVNHDGLSARDHLEHVHGTDTAGMSNSAVVQARNDYHNTYGSGHPVKSQSILSKITVNTTVSCAGAKASCAGVTPTATTDASIASAGSERRKFHRALMQAARAAKDKGEITAFQLATLNVLSRSPSQIDKIQAVIHETAIEEGMATATAIDWDKLILFIEKLIPLIIQLIGLFG